MMQGREGGSSHAVRPTPPRAQQQHPQPRSFARAATSSSLTAHGSGALRVLASRFLLVLLPPLVPMLLLMLGPLPASSGRAAATSSAASALRKVGPASPSPSAPPPLPRSVPRRRPASTGLEKALASTMVLYRRLSFYRSYARCRAVLSSLSERARETTRPRGAQKAPRSPRELKSSRRARCRQRSCHALSTGDSRCYFL